MPFGKAHESPENLLASVMIQSVSVRREYARDFKFNPPGVCVSSLWEGRNLTCVRTFKTMRWKDILGRFHEMLYCPFLLGKAK